MDFGNLYSYSTDRGIVIPQTSSVKENIESAFKSVFGSDFSVDPETPQGRIIEALTLLFVDALRITAINANSFNPEQAVGSYLDNLGNMFGIPRSGKSDEQLRQSIINSQSKTNGYPQSITNAVSNVSHVGSVCVLENGHPYPVVLPNSENGIAVPAHSIFVCVGGDGSGTDFDNDSVATAIYQTKSAGCGYTTDPEYGTVISRTITDQTTGSSNVVKFYRSSEIGVTIAVTVNGSKYTGTDIVDDVTNIVNNTVRSEVGGTSLSAIDISNSILDSGIGARATNVTISIGGSSVSSVTIKPYNTISASSITVSVE